MTADQSHKQGGCGYASGGLLLTNPGGEKGISIGLWATEKDMTKTTKAVSFENGSRNSTNFCCTPVMEHYEVGNKSM